MDYYMFYNDNIIKYKINISFIELIDLFNKNIKRYSKRNIKNIRFDCINETLDDVAVKYNYDFCMCEDGLDELNINKFQYDSLYVTRTVMFYKYPIINYILLYIFNRPCSPAKILKMYLNNDEEIKEYFGEIDSHLTLEEKLNIIKEFTNLINIQLEEVISLEDVLNLDCDLIDIQNDVSKILNFKI